jgi:predicted dithiol-disulfide oxidoreductase (DUF899 family)
MDDHSLPEVVDRQVWQGELDRLLEREKAHTREGDAIAAARRRLPMVEVDAQVPLVGEDGQVPLVAAFEGRRQLIAYLHMWHDGKPAAEQCEGCTFFTAHAPEPSYLHSRDVTYATFCQGDYAESVRYRDFMGWEMPWYSARAAAAAGLFGERAFGGYACYLRDGDRVFETYWTTGRGTEVTATSYRLLDLTPFGRQETWEDSPEGRPHPTAQWARLRAGLSDDLTGSA